MRPKARRGRLARVVYAYTAVCVVGAIAVFLAIATWHFSIRQPRSAAGPPERMGSPGFDHILAKERPPLPPEPPSRRPPTDLLIIVGGILLILVAIGSYLFARRLTRPLRKLERAALAYADGDRSARADIHQDDEIGAAGHAFDAMAERTTRLLRSQEELLANVSHELRTPLARMRVALDIASERSQGASPQLIESLDLDVIELQTLIDSVLSSLRLAMTDELREVELVAVDDLASEVAERFQKLHPDRPLRLELGATPATCEVQPELLRRALQNLLDNARKYSDSEIVLRTSTSGNTVFLEVEDHGIGVSDADQERIFEPFFRTDPSRHRETGGVGLGLSLVKRIIEAHHGTVRLDSAEGSGTTFQLEIPLRAFPSQNSSHRSNASLGAPTTKTERSSFDL